MLSRYNVYFIRKVFQNYNAQQNETNCFRWLDRMNQRTGSPQTVSLVTTSLQLKIFRACKTLYFIT